jgi:hypothetical protein
MPGVLVLMTAMAIEDFRKLLGERLNAWTDTHQNQPGYRVPPPQIIEGMVNLESSFDPELVQPGSGAIGLGQITTGGLEWGIYQADHPGADPNKLTDPATNLDVMIEGLSYRQAQGEQQNGAWQDWYLAAGGYLGGLNNDGTDNGPDGLGTTWQDYVRRVRTYIGATWGNQAAIDVDLLQPKAAVAAGSDWTEGEITYDPTAKAGPEPQTLLDRLISTFGSGVKTVTNAATGAVSGVASDVVNALWGVIGGTVKAWAPRVGLAVGGLALLVVGVLVLTRTNPVTALAGSKGTANG